jgi:hypothetical protein
VDLNDSFGGFIEIKTHCHCQSIQSKLSKPELEQDDLA